MGDAAPQHIGSFAIIRLLHDGPEGSVYLGKHPVRTKNYITIHVYPLPLPTNETREAFLARAKSLKKLKHRNIAEVVDYGLLAEEAVGKQQSPQGYLVMQYVTGKSIHEHFPAGQCHKPDEVKRILSPIADALQYAHTMHIQHGNLHPGNILIDESNQILLAGFSPMPPDLLQPQYQEPAATLYMAPEQLQGDPTPTSDQYALAVMVYEWLCGRRPYSATEREALLQQQLHEPLPTPRSLNSDISPAVEQVLLKTLATDPAERFPLTHTFAYEYLRALMGFSGPPAIATTTPTPSISKTREGDIKDVKANKGALNRAPTDDDANVGTRFIAPSPPSPTAQPKDDDTGVGARFIAPSSPHATPPPNAEDNDEETSTTQDDRPKVKRFSTGSITNLHKIVTTDLRQGGILSKRLDGYEERTAQIEMAREVARALTEEQHAIVEASTGTGKSLAYLLPIVRSGRGAIISTANKALQEQLFFKDIPFVKKNVQEFEAALVKGMGNYICLDRLEDERKNELAASKNIDFMRLINVVKEFELTISGDFETLGFSTPGELRGRVNADRDQCAWMECDFFSRCYVREMKERAEKAQVIVVNHTLLLLDAASNGHVLPQREVVVVDEAHHLEEEATRAFTTTVNQSQVYALLALRRLREHSAASLQEQVKEQLMIAWDDLERVADPGFKGRANLREPLENGLKLASLIEQLGTSLEMQRPLYMSEKEETLYNKLINRTNTLAEDIRDVFSVKQPDKFVYYVERVATHSKRISPLEVSAAPLDVTLWLREHLFNKTHVVATSATLTTVGTNPLNPEDKGPTFAFFRKRVGLDHKNYPDVQERILPLTFDYEKNALLYLPRHLPQPVYGTGADSIGYTKAIADEMMHLVEASRGRAFLLFSSKRMLNDVYQEFVMRLPQRSNYRLLRQGDMTRIEMVREFRESEGAVLFGLKSFWEGVDIAGEALSLVVIDKMPFDPPDDPVQEARVAQMKARGEDWFGSYVLPQAVLRLKQGLGRLLRTHDDRGVMAILDSRLHKKGYGKLVINALPPARRAYDIQDVERFFAVAEEDAPF